MLSTSNPQTILCPICATVRERPRLTMPKLKSIGLSVVIGLTAGAAAFLLWNPVTASLVGASGGVLCFLFLEVYYSLHFRRELECPVCHFDPLLYRKSPEKAKAQCLEGLKRKEQMLNQRWQTMRRDGERVKDLHG